MIESTKVHWVVAKHVLRYLRGTKIMDYVTHRLME